MTHRIARLLVYNILAIIILGSEPAIAQTEFQIHGPAIPCGIQAKDPVPSQPGSSESDTPPSRRQPPTFLRGSSIRLVAPKFRLEHDNSNQMWLFWEQRRFHADLVLSDAGLQRLNLRIPTELFDVKFDPGLSLRFSEDGAWPTTVALQARTRISQRLSRENKKTGGLESGLVRFEAWRELPLQNGTLPLYRYSISLPPDKSGRVFGLQSEQLLLSVDYNPQRLTSTSVIRGQRRRNMYDPLPAVLETREFSGPFYSWPVDTGTFKIWFAARNGSREWFFRVSYENFKS